MGLVCDFNSSIPDYDPGMTTKLPQVADKRASEPEVGVNNYQGFTHSKVKSVKKSTQPYKSRTLKSDVRIDHNVEIKIRESVRLYAENHRPADAKDGGKLPAVVSWSYYGEE
jgi:predicted acyl esterase